MNVGLLFGIIFAIIVMGFVVFFGQDMITQFFGIGQEAARLQQINDFEHDVSNVKSLAMGSSKPFTFKVFSEIRKSCFVDPNNPEANPSAGWDPEDMVSVSVSDNGYNVIYFRGNIFEGFSVERMVPRENFCISQTTKLILENEGTYVSVRT